MAKSLKELIENAEETIKSAYEKGYYDGRMAREAEIVRCKDCVHRHQTTCPFLIANAYKASSDDDFCSRGERRDDE